MEKRLISSDVIAFSYILLSSVVCKVFDVIKIIKLFLALPSFLLLPYLFGRIGISIVEKHFLKARCDVVSGFIISWWIGALLMLFIALLMDFFHIFNISLYVVIILISTVLITLYKGFFTTVDACKRAKEELNNVFGNYKILALCICAGLAPAIYYSTFLPFPQQYHLVLPHLNKAILDILSNNPYSYSSLTYSYTIVPFLEFAVTSVLFNVQSHLLFWVLPFLFYPTFSIGLYLFSYQLSKSASVSLLSSFIGVWIMTNNGGFQENFSIIPRAFAYVFFPFALFLVEKEILKRKLAVRDVVLPSIITGIFSFFHLALIGFFIKGIIVPPCHLKNWQI